MADAILGRIVHSSHRIALKGASLRKPEGQAMRRRNDRCAQTSAYQSRAVNTACPPRRSVGTSQAPTDRRRGQACSRKHQPGIAFGAELPTPAMLAGVDNSATSRPLRTPEIR